VGLMVQHKKRLMLGHVTIQVRGDAELKQRLESFFSAYPEIPRSALSQMICEFALFVHEEIKDGAELILRKANKEQKVFFPGRLSLQFTE